MEAPDLPLPELDLPRRDPEAAPVRRPRHRAVAVAGLDLEQVDYEQIEGHELELATVQKLLSRLSSLPLDERRELRGMDPDRAPTIIAGVIILIKTMRAFALQRITVSERDILFGAAQRAAERHVPAG